MPSDEEFGVAALEAAFRRIAATRMTGLPLNHPRLAVEGVGFRLWQGKRLGVLVTPWAVNLVLLPGGDPGFGSLAADRRQTWRFPAGEYDFMGGSEPECGAFQFCSLVSPIPTNEIADQAGARALAHEVLGGLFTGPAGAAAVAPGGTETPLRARLSGPLSRRGFLSGGLAG